MNMPGARCAAAAPVVVGQLVLQWNVCIKCFDIWRAMNVRVHGTLHEKMWHN